MKLIQHLWKTAITALALVLSASAQLTPTDDTYINPAQPNKNFGSAANIQVAGSGQNAFVRFDLSGLPPNLTSADLRKASLKIFVASVSAPGSFDVDRVNSPWAEKTATTNNAPLLGSTINSGVAVSSSSADTYLLIDVTQAVGEWLDGINPNNGVALVVSGAAAFSFNSKENGATSHPPELDLVLKGPVGPPGPQGPPGPMGSQGAPVLRGHKGQPVRKGQPDHQPSRTTLSSPQMEPLQCRKE